MPFSGILIIVFAIKWEECIAKKFIQTPLAQHKRFFKGEISREAAMVVYWLHKNGHHKTPCTEEIVTKAVIKEFKREDGSPLTADEITAAITFLNKYHVIYIKDEKIKLVESVKVG